MYSTPKCRGYVYFGSKTIFIPPPFLKMIFFPSCDMPFFDSHRALFTFLLILHLFYPYLLFSVFSCVLIAYSSVNNQKYVKMKFNLINEKEYENEHGYGLFMDMEQHGHGHQILASHCQANSEPISSLCPRIRAQYCRRTVRRSPR
jgi:hypothetical protein